MQIVAAAIAPCVAQTQTSAGQITVLYDAFGKTSAMTKDWGFAALIEYGGKRILGCRCPNGWFHDWNKKKFYKGSHFMMDVF